MSSNDNFFKYVSILDIAVGQLHRKLFPANNKRVESKLAQPNISLWNSQAPSDKEPRCISNDGGVTYVFHFPLGDSAFPLQYGVWEESVSLLGALQGAMDFAHHVPLCLQGHEQHMSTLEIKEYSLYVFDNRMLHIRIANMNPVVCVTWTAPPKSRATLNLVLEKKTTKSGFTLKQPHERHFKMPTEPQTEGNISMLTIANTN